MTIKRFHVKQEVTVGGQGEAIGTVARELRELQQLVDRYDEAVAMQLGINRTDLRALDVLEHVGPMTAGQLAEAVGLTSGSTTTMLDRLARAGYVARIRDEVDKRRVLVELTPLVEDRLAELYGARIARPGQASARRFTVDELDIVARFLAVSREVYEAALAADADPAP